MTKVALGFVFVVSLLLRIWNLSEYPVGFTPDEASFGYDAYSLLKTGRDQWGQTWPVILQSFGDFKYPLMSYLIIPSIAVFGLTEFAVRLPNALLGALTPIVVYFLVLELFPIGQEQRKFALIASFFLALSPWHISLSRGAFEANLGIFFTSLGILFYLKNTRTSLIFAALSFGLSMFTYHTARFLTPLLVGILFYLRRIPVDKLRIPFGVFLAFLFIAGLTMFLGSAERGTDIAIFNPTDKWESVAKRRYEAVLHGVPDQIARIFSNKAVYIGDKFFDNYLSYFSPQFLFTQGAGEWTYGMIPGRGVVYLIEALFIGVSVIIFIRKPNPANGFLIAWILLAPIPAAFSKGHLAANRVALMMPAIQIISAYGAYSFIKFFDKKFKLILSGTILLIAVMVISLVFFLEDYFFHAPADHARYMLYGRREAVRLVQSIEQDYENIIVSRRLSEPHIYFAFYQKFNPFLYQEYTRQWIGYKQQGYSFVDQLPEYRLGKYTFKNIEFEQDKKLPNTLLVGVLDEFPQDIKPLYTIYYPDGEPVILIVDTGRLTHANND